MSERKDIHSFCFRNIHKDLFFGTASDRYAGWLGQIYTPERYRGKITRRTKKVGRKNFVEQVLPVESVVEYFEHFSVLELDFTFYAPLRDANGNPTRIYHALKSYAGYLKEADKIILKAPQAFFAKNTWQGDLFDTNRAYLDSSAFIAQFYDPAAEVLGPRLHAIVFEQEYHRKQGRPEPGEIARELDRFFQALPEDPRYHVELRTEPFLCAELFQVLAAHGVGQVFSHWTWLPSLRRQFRLSGGKFFNSSGDVVIRLMTPRGMRYEEAYARAHPFNRLVEGMLQEAMVQDTVFLAKEALAQGARPSIIINNRAGGNAPLIARKIGEALVTALAGQ